VRLRVVARPELFVDLGIDALDDAGAPDVEFLPFHGGKGSD
jgi:hypothetical protein